MSKMRQLAGHEIVREGDFMKSEQFTSKVDSAILGFRADSFQIPIYRLFSGPGPRRSETEATLTAALSQFMREAELNLVQTAQ